MCVFVFMDLSVCVKQYVFILFHRFHKATEPVLD